MEPITVKDSFIPYRSGSGKGFCVQIPKGVGMITGDAGIYIASDLEESMLREITGKYGDPVVHSHDLTILPDGNQLTGFSLSPFNLNGTLLLRYGADGIRIPCCRHCGEFPGQEAAYDTFNPVIRGEPAIFCANGDSRPHPSRCANEFSMDKGPVLKVTIADISDISHAVEKAMAEREHNPQHLNRIGL